MEKTHVLGENLTRDNVSVTKTTCKALWLHPDLRGEKPTATWATLWPDLYLHNTQRTQLRTWHVMGYVCAQEVAWIGATGHGLHLTVVLWSQIDWSRPPWMIPFWPTVSLYSTNFLKLYKVFVQRERGRSATPGKENANRCFKSIVIWTSNNSSLWGRRTVKLLLINYYVLL
jgi:hypothetical protein